MGLLLLWTESDHPKLNFDAFYDGISAEHDYEFTLPNDDKLLINTSWYRSLETNSMTSYIPNFNLSISNLYFIVAK